MKKVLALLLSFVVVTGAFAIDVGNGLSILGEVKAGLKVFSRGDDDNSDTDETRVEPWNDDAGESLRTRLTFQYDVDAGGVKIRQQAIGAGGFTTKYAYGWLNLLDKQIRLSAGQIGDDVWGLGKITNVFDPSHDAVGGVRAQFKFVEGLDFGLALPLSSLNRRVGEGASAEPVWPLVGEFLGGAVIGGLYTSDAFKVVAALKLIPEISATKRGAPDGTDPFKGYVDVIGGVEVPLGDLTLAVNARLDTRKHEDHGKTGYTRIGPKVVYKAGALTAYARGDIWLTGEADKPITATNDKGERIFTLNTKEAGDAAIAFRLHGEYKVNDTISPFAQFGSDNVSFAAYHGFYLKPGVTFTFGPSTIVIFDKISNMGADLDLAATDGGPGKKVTNQFQIDFNLSF